jgi:hypothetical protein
VGSLLTSILQGAGRAGGDAREAQLSLQEEKRKQQDQALKMQEFQAQMRELAQRLQMSQFTQQRESAPQYVGSVASGGKQYDMLRDPMSGKLTYQLSPVGAPPAKYTELKEDAQGKLWGMNSATNQYEPVPASSGFQGKKEKPTEAEQTRADYAKSGSKLSFEAWKAEEAAKGREPIEEAKEARLLNRQMELIGAQIQKSLELGEAADARKGIDEARKILVKAQEAYRQDQYRFELMSQLAKQYALHPDDPGAFDAAMLAFHMGMTVGAVKNLRGGTYTIALHSKARSGAEGLEVALGNWIDGRQLSDEQRTNFVELAAEKMVASKDDIDLAQKYVDVAEQAYKQVRRGVMNNLPGKKAKEPTSGVIVVTPEEMAK